MYNYLLYVSIEVSKYPKAGQGTKAIRTKLSGGLEFLFTFGEEISSLSAPILLPANKTM